MRLSLALIPPPLVLEDLAAVVRSVRGSDRELTTVPTELMTVPLGHFGNVGLAARVELEEVLRDEVARWAPMQLRFEGGAALVTSGDDSLWARVGGDVEELTAMGTVVPRVVHRLGFLIDRRIFRTEMRVGRITPATSLDFLERALQRLDGYCGPAWTAHHVSLLRHLTGSDGGDPSIEVLHDLRLVGDEQAVGATGTDGGRHRS